MRQERRAHAVVHLIAARADARSDGRHQISRRARPARRWPRRRRAPQPAQVPRQPACTAATTRRCRSASRIGTQSATRTAMALRRIGARRWRRPRDGCGRRASPRAHDQHGAAVHLRDADDVVRRDVRATSPKSRVVVVGRSSPEGQGARREDVRRERRPARRATRACPAGLSTHSKLGGNCSCHLFSMAQASRCNCSASLPSPLGAALCERAADLTLPLLILRRRARRRLDVGPPLARRACVAGR